MSLQLEIFINQPNAISILFDSICGLLYAQVLNQSKLTCQYCIQYEFEWKGHTFQDGIENSRYSKQECLFPVAFINRPA